MFCVHKNANKVQWVKRVCFHIDQKTLDSLMLVLLSSGMNEASTPASISGTPTGVLLLLVREHEHFVKGQ